MLGKELELVLEARARAWTPPPKLTVSEWANRYRVLPRETTMEHGQYRWERTPYLREVMDSLSSLDRTERVVLMKSAQVGATEAGLNWIGFSIHHDPGPMLLLVPGFDFAKKYSKRRIAPMIANTPALRDRVSKARARDSGNTLLVKEFEGGMLAIASAESPSSLASDPIRRIFMDEIDLYPKDVDDKGTPLGMAAVRTTTFSNRKAFFTSTPGRKDDSYIEPAFLMGDMRRFFLPCPHCGAMDFITWSGFDPFKTDEREHYKIVWDEDSAQTASMLCPVCGVYIEERYKTQMMAAGEWRPTSKGDAITRSFHLPGMYSPIGWLSWETMVDEWLKAIAGGKRGDFSLLQDFLNLRLGETWEERGEKLDEKNLLSRAEIYAAQVPDGVGVLVASVDVQADRLEAQVVGFGALEESWLIDWRQFHGDPEGEAVWFELDRYLQRTWVHQSGRAMGVECVTVDSGGHHAEQVYAFCKVRMSRGIWAIKGGSEIGKPLVERPTRNNRYRTPLFLLCVDTGKDRVYSRLKITEPGPGYFHFPVAPWFDDEYVAQLTAEKKIRKSIKGRGSVPAWKQLRERNEALDLTVYALAALYILGADYIEMLPQEAEKWARPLESGEVAAQPEQEAEPVQEIQMPTGFPGIARRNWVNSWR